MPQEFHPEFDPAAHRARGLEIERRVRAAVDATRHVGVPESDLAAFAEAVLRRLSPADRARVIANVAGVN